MNRQTTLRPSQGGKFHVPVEPSEDIKKQVKMAEDQMIINITYKSFLDRIQNPWQNELMGTFPPDMQHGPKSEVRFNKDGKKFIVYSA